MICVDAILHQKTLTTQQQTNNERNFARSWTALLHCSNLHGNSYRCNGCRFGKWMA